MIDIDLLIDNAATASQNASLLEPVTREAIRLNIVDKLLSSTQDQVPVEVATVSDHNAAFDPANDAFGGAFKDGFREGWLFAQDPGFEDREDLEADYSRTVDIAPSECWDAYRSHYFSMLPLASIPEVGSAIVASTPPAPVSSETVDATRLHMLADNWEGRSDTAVGDEIRRRCAAELRAALTPSQPLPASPNTKEQE